MKQDGAVGKVDIQIVEVLIELKGAVGANRVAKDTPLVERKLGIGQDLVR